MTLTAFLKIDDIPGESVTANHEAEIEIHGLRWGVERNDQGGGGRGRARAKVDPLKLHKYYDAASPYLAKDCFRGKTHREMVLTVRRNTGQEPLDYLTITMTNASIIDVVLTNNDDDDAQIHEIVTITAQEIHKTYVQTDVSGATTGEHSTKFELAKGT